MWTKRFKRSSSGVLWWLWLWFKLCLPVTERLSGGSPRWSTTPLNASCSVSSHKHACLKRFLHVQEKAWRISCTEYAPDCDHPRSIVRCIYKCPLTRADAGSHFLLILDELDRHDTRESADALPWRDRIILISRLICKSTHGHSNRKARQVEPVSIANPLF